MTHLLQSGVITPVPRNVDALSIRSVQLLNCLQKGFDDKSTDGIFASNFFLDKPKHLWSAETNLKGLRDVLNNLESMGKMEPENDLRGAFVITGKSGRKARIVFTMTPENPPRIQTMKVFCL
jgi:hypothetical protein